MARKKRTSRTTRNPEPEMIALMDHIERSGTPLNQIAVKLDWDRNRLYKYAKTGGIKLASFTALAEAAGLSVELVPRRVA